jgi:transposase-like protein
MLNQLMEILDDKKIFIRYRNSNKTKALAMLIYHAGLFYRKTSAIIGELENFSYEALRKWYKKCASLFQPGKQIRRIIAVDETMIKKEGLQIYIWNVIDIEAKTIIAVHLSTSRRSFDTIYFLRRVLVAYNNQPFILVDWGPWYRWAFQRFGLPFEHQTFGERNAIEQWYSQFKARVNRFWKRFHYHSSLQSRQLWCNA